MNWLAHLFLSEPTPAFRIGNLLPDLTRAATLTDLPAEFQRGVKHHHQIDAFTDSHVIVGRSKNRIAPPFRRFAGILIDVFFDHILSRDWDAYSSTPLTNFLSEFYASFEDARAHIPAEAYLRLEEIRHQDFLCSYRNLDGVADALQRIGKRFRRPVPLGESIVILEDNYDLFRADFGAFFPELVSNFAPKSLRTC